jgi:putative transposase
VRTWGPKGQTPLVWQWGTRDHLSTITALTVSPTRQRLRLYLHTLPRAFNGLDVRAFVRALRRHLRGAVVLLGDRGTIHRRREVQVCILAHRRLHQAFFPAYAPELNPAEHVWTQTDRRLANSAPPDLEAECCSRGDYGCDG